MIPLPIWFKIVDEYYSFARNPFIWRWVTWSPTGATLGKPTVHTFPYKHSELFSWERNSWLGLKAGSPFFRWHGHPPSRANFSSFEHSGSPSRVDSGIARPIGSGKGLSHFLIKMLVKVDSAEGVGRGGGGGGGGGGECDPLSLDKFPSYNGALVFDVL